MNEAMKIAVFSGSFNPMHTGHTAIVRYLLDNGGFDKVYLVVSPQNPFKDASLSDNSDTRLEKAENAVRRAGLSGRVVVEDIEFSMPQPSYSIRTLDALQAREPENRFTLVIGGDNLSRMLEWREGDRIMYQYGIAVYPRTGTDLTKECRILKNKFRNAEKLFSPEQTHRPLHIKLLHDAPIVDISSTRIREMQAAGLDVSAYLA